MNMTSEWKSDFTQISNYLIRDPEISGNELKIYLDLLTYCYGDKETCFPSLNTLVSDTGITKKTIIKALETLEIKGYLKKEYRTKISKSGNEYNDNNLYTLSIPQHIKQRMIEQQKKKLEKELNNVNKVDSVKNTPSATNSKKVVEKLHQLDSGENTPSMVENLHNTNNINKNNTNFNNNNVCSEVTGDLINSNDKDTHMFDNSHEKVQAIMSECNCSYETVLNALQKAYKMGVDDIFSYSKAILRNAKNKPISDNNSLKNSLASKSKKNKFLNFPQTRYNFEEIESLEMNRMQKGLNNVPEGLSSEEFKKWCMGNL